MANKTQGKEQFEQSALGSVSSANFATSQRFAGGKTTESKVVETEGENVLASPASGKAITLYWIALTSSETNSAEVLAEVKLGSLVPYTWYLGKPWAFVHWEPVVGAENAKLVLKLSAAQKVACSFTYTEG